MITRLRSGQVRRACRLASRTCCTWFMAWTTIFVGLMSGSKPGEAREPQKVAFVVGVSHYTKANLRELQYAHSDALAVAQLLQRSGFEVQSFVDSNATVQAVQQGIDQFMQKCRGLEKDDVVVIFLAGHGLQDMKIETAEKGGKKVAAAYFCVADSNKFNLDSLISIDSLIDRLAITSSSENNILVIDACRDASERGLDGGAYSHVPNNTSILWACSPGQRSHESPKLKQGLLTHYLLKGLTGAAANVRGDVDWLTLAAYVRNEVDRNCAEIFENPDFKQRPNLVGNHLGSPILRQSRIELPKLLRLPFKASDIDRAREQWTSSLKIPTSFVNSLGMEFVLIPPGEFTMGSPAAPTVRADETAHQVRLTRPIYCCRTELTQRQWTSVMQDSPWEQDPLRLAQSNEDHPATMMTWKEAKNFCRQLSEREGRTYRLPSEAEWEYICRAGTETEFHCQPSMFSQFAWFKDNAWDADEKFAHSVGRKQPNIFGIMDMYGNVSEYCEDFYSDMYYGVSPVENPTGANVGELHVIRGGSFAHQQFDCRSARRLRPYQLKDPTIGFRTVVEISW